MVRQKLGIISSYNEQCGNASYTHVLKGEFARHYDVEVIAVNSGMLSGPGGAMNLRRICQRIAEKDLINIQFESQLYGRSPSEIADNVCAMVASARRLVFTMHRVQVPEPTRMSVLRLIYGVLRRRNVPAMLRSWRGNILVNRMMRQITRAIQAKHKGNPMQATVVVHTARERQLLAMHYNLSCVVDYPITFLNRHQIAEQIAHRDEIRLEVLQKYDLDPDKKYIGIFGFLSENKGHHIAIEAMRFLPSSYVLLVFGGQHPMSFEAYDFAYLNTKPERYLHNKHPYVASVVELAKAVVTSDAAGRPNDTHQHRVQFLGTVDDADFIRGITAMDFVVLPYLESGQGGSANAALMVELRTRAIMSRNTTFMELAEYYPGCFALVDMANPLQLAQTIHRWHDDQSAAIDRWTACYNIENSILFHKRAFEHGAEGAMEFKRQLTAGGRDGPATAIRDEAPRGDTPGQRVGSPGRRSSAPGPALADAIGSDSRS